jgi:hypothetical protein
VHNDANDVGSRIFQKSNFLEKTTNKTRYDCNCNIIRRVFIIHICLITMKKDFSWTKDDNDMIFNHTSPEEVKRPQKKKPMGLAQGGVSFQTSSGEGRYVSGTCPRSYSNEYSADMSKSLSPKPHHQYRETATASRQEIRDQRSRQSSPAKALDKSRTGSSRGTVITPGSSLSRLPSARGGKGSSGVSTSTPLSLDIRINQKRSTSTIHPTAPVADRISNKFLEHSHGKTLSSIPVPVPIKKREVENKPPALKDPAPEVICLDDDEEDEEGDDDPLRPLKDMYHRINRVPLGTLKYKEAELGSGYSIDLHMVFVGKTHFQFPDPKNQHCSLEISAGKFVLSIPDISGKSHVMRTKKGRRALVHEEKIPIDLISKIMYV